MRYKTLIKHGLLSCTISLNCQFFLWMSCKSWHWKIYFINLIFFLFLNATNFRVTSQGLRLIRLRWSRHFEIQFKLFQNIFIYFTKRKHEKMALDPSLPFNRFMTMTMMPPRHFESKMTMAPDVIEKKMTASWQFGHHR